MNDIINLKTWLIKNLFLLSIGCTVAMGRVIYVDTDATGTNDGSTWENAYKYLQEALADASSMAKPVEIRIAQGVYRPNQGLVAIPEFDWRTTTFQMLNGVILKGGYAGLGEPDPNARDIELYETVLSGDLYGNDVDVNNPADLLDEPTRAENSYHVVTGSGTDNSTVLDGFTITAGNANGPLLGEHPNFDLRLRYGAGMSNVSGSLTLTNCTFAGNSADYGDALACDSHNHEHPSILELINSILWDNGNEIWNSDGSAIIISYSDIQGGHDGVYDRYEAVI